jgi:molecular chaperone GrpE
MTMSPTERSLPDDETLLARLRQWLAQTRAEVDGAAADTDVDADTDVGLYRLVEEFTALRQEVKLQTKGTRGLQEQADALLGGLRQAIEQFRSVGPKENDDAFAVGRPLAEALADLDEALDRGRAGAEAARERSKHDPLPAELDAYLARQGWFRRRRLRAYHREIQAVVARVGRQPSPDLIAALMEGYDLIQARLRRTLNAEQICRIDCVGHPVDPGRMTVVALVDAPDAAPGSVVDEVRPGYTWRDCVLRYAEVRAARPPAGMDTSDQ